MKVLAIEDEPLIRDIYAEFLELLGYEAVAFAELKATLAAVVEPAGAAK
jgi:DNA-binding response OmpR family regulator